jgi:hypothetical protein
MSLWRCNIKDEPVKLFNQQHLEEIARAISEIRSQGGYGEVVIKFHRGQPRYIGWTVTKQFNLEQVNEAAQI